MKLSVELLVSNVIEGHNMAREMLDDAGPALEPGSTQEKRPQEACVIFSTISKKSLD